VGSNPSPGLLKKGGVDCKSDFFSYSLAQALAGELRL
jgi:hypothetical protein